MSGGTKRSLFVPLTLPFSCPLKVTDDVFVPLKVTNLGARKVMMKFDEVKKEVKLETKSEVDMFVGNGAMET